MTGIRGVISTLTPDGQEMMGPNVLLWHYPNNDIMSGSLLTVESRPCWRSCWPMTTT